MRKFRNIFLFLTSLFLVSCSGRQVRKYLPVTLEQYKLYDWQKKIDFFNTAYSDPKSEKYIIKEIYLEAFQDKVPAVTISALKSLPDFYSFEFKPEFYSMVRVKNPVIRWQICEKIAVKPVPNDIPYLVAYFADRDWMVRECAFRNFRKYPEEKKEKKYFFPIISYLYEKNAQVLKQVYKTLKWYDDKRAYPYLFKRSFVVDTNAEMIVIIQELAEIDEDAVKRRIWYISKNYPDFFVRKESERVLDSIR